MRKRVDTTISEDKWKKAVIHSIRWNEAIEIGVDMLVDGCSMDKEKLKEKIEEHSNKQQYYQELLDRMEAQERENKTALEVAEKFADLMKESIDVLDKDIKFLQGRTNLWNNKTGMRMSPEEFYKLCRRYEEFKKTEERVANVDGVPAQA